MRLHRAIKQANEEGRLGLILYVVPNFPDPNQFGRILARLDSSGFVSIIETTIPTVEGFSDHANDTIRNAHIEAARYHFPSPLRRSDKPMLCVLYRGTVEKSTFEKVLLDNKGAWEGLLLEWSEENEAPYVKTANRHDMELVQCVGPWMSRKKIRETLAFAIPEPLVYLMSAPMTGARLFGNGDLRRCIETIKSIRPAAKIAAGFGIRGADDIEVLSTVEGLDAVIIGTAFLETMSRGDRAVGEFLSSIEPVLNLRDAKVSVHDSV